MRKLKESKFTGRGGAGVGWGLQGVRRHGGREGVQTYLFLLRGEKIKKEDRASHASLETDKDPAGDRWQRAGTHTPGMEGPTRGDHTHTHTH